MPSKALRPLESSIERRFAAEVRRRGGECLKLGQDGWPDRIVLLPGGKVLFIELKRPGETPRPRQWSRINALTMLGFNAVWADSFEGAVAHLP
jgi:hypothetical protein